MIRYLLTIPLLALVLAASCDTPWGASGAQDQPTTSGGLAPSPYCPSGGALFAYNCANCTGTEGYSGSAWQACQGAPVSPITGLSCAGEATCATPFCAPNTDAAQLAAQLQAQAVVGQDSSLLVVGPITSAADLYSALLQCGLNGGSCLVPTPCAEVGEQCTVDLNDATGAPGEIKCCDPLWCSEGECCKPTEQACAADSECCAPAVCGEGGDCCGPHGAECAGEDAECCPGLACVPKENNDFEGNCL